MADADLAAEQAAEQLPELEDIEPERCPFCGEVIPEDRRELHAAGLDRRRSPARIRT